MNKKMRELLAAIDAKQAECKGFLDSGDTEKSKACMSEIEGLQEQYMVAEKLYAMEKGNVPFSDGEAENDTKEAADIKAFNGYIRSVVEKTSTPQNISMGNNGAIIPETIADRIINQTKNVCPIFAGCTLFHVKGTLHIPVYSDKTDDGGNAHNINIGWAAEFTELTADAGAFTSVDLTGFLVGVLTLVGKNVIKNSDIDVVNFIVREMGRRIGWWLELKLLTGETNYNTGALSSGNTMTAASSTTISADELVDLQLKVSQEYQSNACWTMHPNTVGALRKLKYTDGSYMLQQDFTQAIPFRLLGKPIHMSDNMPKIEASAKAVLYGDYAALAVNMPEEIDIQVLTEKYATMHAIGVNGWFEVDSDIMDKNGLAVLVMKATA